MVRSSRVRHSAAALHLGGLLGGPGIEKYATFLDEFDYDQIGSENLLKAADDWTNTSYWTHNNCTVTDEGSGKFKVESGGASSWCWQYLNNWFPEWAGRISYVVEVLKGTEDSTSVGLKIDGAYQAGDAEVLSGPGSIGGGGVQDVSNLSTTEWTKIRIGGDAKGWATEIRVVNGPGSADVGDYTYFRNAQVILGDQPDEKPRPVGQETDYPMMAHRPHWRLTKDGGARINVGKDTQGTIWCGDMGGGDLPPVQTTRTFDCPANGFLECHFTYETGKYVTPKYRYQNGSNHYYLYCGTGGQVELYKREGGTPQKILTAKTSGFLTDTERYRVRLEFVDDSHKVYIDDEFCGEATNDWLEGQTGGAHYESNVTDGTVIICESNPKGNGLILAVSEPPASDDPRISWTDTDGSALDIDATDAMLATLDSFSAGNTTHRVGFDNATSGAVIGANYRFGVPVICHNSYGNSMVDNFAGNTQRSFIVMQRSDTHGYHYLDFDTGKSWKFGLPHDAAEIGVNQFPAISNYNLLNCYRRIALLDLSSKWDRDFAEVTDSESTPASPTQFDCEADFEMRFGYTMELGQKTYFEGRYTDGSNRFYAEMWSNGYVYLRNIVDGDLQTVGSINLAALDGTWIDFVIVAEGSEVALYYNNILAVSGTVTNDGNNNVAQGNVSHNLATNDIELTTHPYPALGVAVDHAICPQVDDIGDCPSDCVIVWRDHQTGTVSVSGTRMFFRIQDATNYMMMQTASSGAAYVYNIVDGAPNFLISMGSGTVSDGDDVMLMVNGTSVEFFVNGTSEGSSNSAGFTTETGWKLSTLEGSGGAIPSAEFWPYDPQMPFKL